MIKSIHKTLLQHMLGADSRYMKKQWGFRNHFCTSTGTADDVELQAMAGEGLVTCKKADEDTRLYHATKAGAVSIGFKPYQLRNTKLAL